MPLILDRIWEERMGRRGIKMEVVKAIPVIYA
jgi:hypothetical protein